MDKKRFTLRMDNDLFEYYRTLSKLHKRSICKEIEFALNEHKNNDINKQKNK